MTTFGQRLKAAREAAGMSQADVEFASRTELPKPMWIGQIRVSRLESGKITEEKAEPFEVAFLASLYGVSTADLSVLADEGMGAIRELVRRGAWLSR